MNSWRRWLFPVGCASAIALAGIAAPPANASFSVAVDLYIQDRQDYDDDVWVEFVPEQEAWVALYAVYSDGSIQLAYPTYGQRAHWARCYGPQLIPIHVPPGLYLESVEAYASYDYFDPWGYYDACRPRYVGAPWHRPCEIAILHSYPVSTWSFSFAWYSGWNDRCDRRVHGSPARRIFAVAGHDFSSWKRKSHSGRRDFYRSRERDYHKVVHHDFDRDRRRGERHYDGDDRDRRHVSRDFDRDDRFRRSVQSDRDNSKHRVERSVERSRDSRIRNERRSDRNDDRRFASRVERREDRDRNDRRFASRGGERVERSNRVDNRRQRVERSNRADNRRERVERSNRVDNRRERVERSNRVDSRRERVERSNRVDNRRERVERSRAENRRERVEQRRPANTSRGRSDASRSESLRKSSDNRRESAGYERRGSGGGKQKAHSGQKSSKSRRVSGEPKGRSRS